MKIEWDDIRSEGFYRGGAELTIRRAKVLGGWLVVVLDWVVRDVEHRTYAWAYGGPVFQPDPEHNWSGNSLT